MKKIIALLCLLIFAGCENERHALKEEEVNNKDYVVELLFEHEGCKMYRFRDKGEWVYYSDCRGKVTANYQEQEGKTTVTKQTQTLNN